jgi:SOUL heme-binding protein
MKLAMIVLSAGIAIGAAKVRADDNTAPFRLLKQDGKFELRKYPGLVIAETPMSDADNGFLRLFRFISGRNARQQKISMTTPVLIAGTTTKLTMAFVMPAGLSRTNTPAPGDQSVTIREIAGGKFAVFRYSGGRNEKNQTAALEKLSAWLAQEKLKTTGTPLYGYFDPPWIPTFFRHNEVMLRLADTAASPADDYALH